MLSISLNPIQKAGIGGYYLSGISTTVGFEIKWWWSNDPSAKFTKFTQINSINWSIDIPLGSAVDVIQIQATKNNELSNTITVDLSTKNEKPEPTYQFNEFDELALEADMDRLPLEGNEEFRQRVIDTYVNPGSSTKVGLINSIERALALPSLRNFFFISARFNPRSGTIYNNVYLSFSHYRCSAQVQGWTKYNELVDLDPVSWTFKTQESIGSENFDTNNKIEIFNVGQSVSTRAFKQIDNNTIWINLNDKRIDATKRLTVSYPYAKTLEYVNADNTLKTVNDVRSFLEGIETVVDENGQIRPLIVWNNGYFKSISYEPSSFNIFQSLEQAINDQPFSNVDYAKIENDSEPYYEYISQFKSKGFFAATQIIPRLSLTLSKSPEPMSCSWIKIDPFHDVDFRNRLDIVEGSTRTLEYYANQLRDLTRMGIYKTVVNKDEWSSDHPAYIGENFIPSKFDGGLQPFTIFSSDGTYKNLTLNERKHYIKMLGGQ